MYVHVYVRDIAAVSICKLLYEQKALTQRCTVCVYIDGISRILYRKYFIDTLFKDVYRETSASLRVRSVNAVVMDFGECRRM